MTGVIWMVQWVHYPLMAEVGDQSFRRYHQRHTERITHLVGPLMLLELVTALLLLLEPGILGSSTAAVALGLLVFIWISTALIQVPQHHYLGTGQSRNVAALVAGNWVRTAAWTARSVLLVGSLS